NLEDMPEGANIGTGSFRRKAQLLHFRPDLNVVDMRGNINTRLQKAQSPDFDGIILAAAGLTRMGWLDRIQQFLSCEIMIPAVGQGALSIQVREDDRAARKLIAPLNDLKTETAVNAERLFLHKMGGGCQTPMGAFCQVRGDQVVLQGFCAEEDGSAFIKKQFEGPVEQALDLAARLAERLLEKSPGNS
ncbi:MAG: hydroxymethylbilane synthase, partial [bacterium]